ncbi:MAG: hypothetical protein PWP04_401 [Candidatus Atribacteria bacterium]|nr:hypothetical protein [Candidatus Atribacteria bacterium]
MNIEQVFQTNRKISLGIQRKSENGQAEIRYYPSRIEGVNQKEVLIAAPQERGELVPVAVAEEIEVYVVGERETFYFQTRVKDRLRKDNLAFLVLELPIKVIRRQRRNFVRLDLCLPVVVKKEGNAFSGATKDLSGGGMLVSFDALPETLEVGDTVWFSLEIETLSRIMGKARAVRKESPTEYAFQFTNIASSDRERIIKLIFRKQIEMRRKGLLN